jgi:hypothetical protein
VDDSCLDVPGEPGDYSGVTAMTVAPRLMRFECSEKSDRKVSRKAAKNAKAMQMMIFFQNVSSRLASPLPARLNDESFGRAHSGGASLREKALFDSVSRNDEQVGYDPRNRQQASPDASG